MTSAELMIKALENEGVKQIFGVPGEENEAFLFALEKSTIKFIPVRHEQGGAFMANVWGRLTGTAGVCLSTLGPGATNLITGVADANLDKAPLVAITGQGEMSRMHHESHQMINVVEMMAQVTKWNTTIQDKYTIPEIVRKAFKLAEMEKPGATHIELPENIANETISKTPSLLNKYKIKRPSPNKEILKEAVNIIRKAERPLILAGNGAIRKRASKLLTQFTTKLNISVATTFMGKGAVSDLEEVSLGAIGLGFKDYVYEAFEKSDLVITIGYDIAEYDPAQWNPKEDKKIINIDFEPAEVYQNFNPEVESVGDIAKSLEELYKELKNESFKSFTKEIKSRISRSIENFSLPSDSKEFHVPGILNAIRENVAKNAIVISDVGSHKMWIARNYKTYVPNGCIISNGLASMGISLPGGIAASLVDPDRTVISLMGDGGAMMNIQELETAVRLGVSCVFIVFNDNNYGLIEWKQKMSHGKSFGTKLGNPDFVKLAESFGIHGYKPSTMLEFQQILTQIIKERKLALIEIPITTEVNQELIKELETYFK